MTQNSLKIMFMMQTYVNDCKFKFMNPWDVPKKPTVVCICDKKYCTVNFNNYYSHKVNIFPIKMQNNILRYINVYIIIIINEYTDFLYIL